jgi:hypothetical protein
MKNSYDEIIKYAFHKASRDFGEQTISWEDKEYLVCSQEMDVLADGDYAEEGVTQFGYLTFFDDEGYRLDAVVRIEGYDVVTEVLSLNKSDYSVYEGVRR